MFSKRLDHFLQNCILWLFCLLVMLLPFIFCWLNDELFEFNKMLFTYFFTILIVTCWIIRMIIHKKFLFHRTILDIPINLFLLSQIISTIFSLHPRTSLLGYYTRLNGGLLSTLSYVLLYYAFVNNLNRENRANFLFATFFSGIIASLYAIFEHFGHSFSCFIIKGNFDVSCWVQDVQTRVFASFGQPNWLAAYNVALIGLGTPLIIKNFSQKKSPNSHFSFSSILNFCLILSVYLNFIALIFTKSRSGILAFFCSFLLTLILTIGSWIRQKTCTRRHWLALSFTCLGFILPTLIWGTQYTPSFNNIIGSASASNLSPLTEQIPALAKNFDLNITDSADIRKVVWLGALDIWRAHPLFGTGVETFAYSYYNYRPLTHNWTSEWDFLYNKAHNELLNLAANSGAFGLLSYLSIFFVFTFFVLKFIWQKNSSPLLVGTLSGLLAISITNFFGFSTVTVQVLLFLFFALGAQILTAKKETGELACSTAPTAEMHTSQKASILVVLAIAIFLISQVWAFWLADYHYALCKSLATNSDINTALEHCSRAIELSHRQEPLYLSDTADFYAQYAVALAEKDPDSPYINLLANESLNLSNTALKENPVHLNLYKTRFRTLSILAQLDPSALTLAESSLAHAIELSPTDPKLYYFYGLIQNKLGNTAAYREAMEKAVDLRPLYLDARLAAAQAAAAQNDVASARAHYQWILDYVDSSNATATQEIANLATLSGIISP